MSSIPSHVAQTGAHEKEGALEGAFRTELGSLYVPVKSGDGRTVYRRHKYDGSDQEPQELTGFVEGLSISEAALLLDITHKHSHRFAPEYKKYLEKFSAVLMQETVDDSFQGELVIEASQLRDGAVSYLMVIQWDETGSSDLVFAKDIAFEPTAGQTVVEFRHAPDKGFLVPSHVGHKVV